MDFTRRQPPTPGALSPAAAPSRAGTALFFAGCGCSGALVLPYPAILVADAMALGAGHGGWSQCWRTADTFFGICLPMAYPLVMIAAGLAAGPLYARGRRWSAAALAWIPALLVGGPLVLMFIP
jgi:hypothetical protein